MVEAYYILRQIDSWCALKRLEKVKRSSLATPIISSV